MLTSTARVRATGHVLIRDKDTQEVLLDKYNAIHFENFVEALALCLANRATGNIHEMAFGNGGSAIDGTGVVTYFPPNTNGQEATLYNETYSKVVDDQSPLNEDATSNKITVQHSQNTTYTDIITTCTLGYGEPSDQDVYDDAINNDGEYVFDELCLKSYNTSAGEGKMLTHVIFHPVQKSQNRRFEIVYTIRLEMV